MRSKSVDRAIGMGETCGRFERDLIGLRQRARAFFVEGSECQTVRCDALLAQIDAAEVGSSRAPA